MVQQYWVVGATWEKDQYEKFIKRGCWEIGYDDVEKPGYANLRAQIKEGDRIAIKSMLGQGSPNIRIKAIGIVKDVDKIVYIHWVIEDLNRVVPSKGSYGTIHGPFTEPKDDEWIGKVFRI